MNRESLTTGDGITISHDRTFVGQSILGVFFLILAICLILYFGRTHPLICDRVENGTVVCSGRIYFLNNVAINKAAIIRHVESAQRATSCQTNSQTLDYRCYLNTVDISGKSGTIHVGQDFLNETTAQDLINEIKNFLNDSGQTHVEISSWNRAILLGGFLFVIPPFLIFGILFLFNRSVSRWISRSGKQKGR